MPQSNFDELVEGGKAVPSGTQHAHIVRPTAATTAPAAATVGADIGAFTDPPSAAQMALLRTFVNANKADIAALSAKVATLVIDLASTNAKLNEALDTLEAFTEAAT